MSTEREWTVTWQRAFRRVPGQPAVLVLRNQERVYLLPQLHRIDVPAGVERRGGWHLTIWDVQVQVFGRRLHEQVQDAYQRDGVA
jgi:hypothetical protein